MIELPKDTLRDALAHCKTGGHLARTAANRRPDTELHWIRMDAAKAINRERIVVLGWGRAILLQLAHPLIAAGVAEHSGFAGERLSRLRRLNGTVGAMLGFTFGPPEAVTATAARINAIHRRVHGRLDDGTACFPAGTPYTATDPDLLLWVHATLLESVPLAFERFVTPLTRAEKDDYCARSAGVGALLGIPRDRLPVTERQLTLLVERVHASGHLEVTPTARAVARDLLYPPLTDPTRPGAWLNRLATLGLLPAGIREQYGFTWTRAHARAFRVASAVIRSAWPRLPRVARHWAVARRQRGGH